jgi:hypothetical protein
MGGGGQPSRLFSSNPSPLGFINDLPGYLGEIRRLEETVTGYGERVAGR